MVPYTAIGLPIESSTTFVACLASLGLGIGFSLALFRYCLFRDPEIHRLDGVLMLFQVSEDHHILRRLVQASERSCAVPQPSFLHFSRMYDPSCQRWNYGFCSRGSECGDFVVSILLSVTAAPQFSQAMLVAMYVFVAPSKNRAIFITSVVAVVILVVAMIDRGIQVPQRVGSERLRIYRIFTPTRSASTTDPLLVSTYNPR